jgi:two-component sensor histidine kinase
MSQTRSRPPIHARLLPRTAAAIKLASVASLSALLTVLVLVGLWSYRSDMRDAEREVGDNARSLTTHIVRVVEAGNLLLLYQQDMASTADPSDRRNIADIDHRLQNIVGAAPYVFRLFMLDAKGDVYASSMRDVPPLNARDREYFQEHQAGLNGLHISSVLRSQATGEPIIIMSRSVLGSRGEFRGVVLVSFELDTLQRFMQTILSEKPAKTFQIIGPNMQVLVDTKNRDRVGTYLSQEMQDHLRLPDSGVIKYAPSNDVSRIWAHEQVGDYPLYVRVGVESAQVFDQWLGVAAPYAIVSVLVAALLTALSGLAIRHAHMAEYARRGLDIANRDLERRVQERTAALATSNLALRDAVKSLETINATNANLAAELDLEKVVQATTDAGVALTGAAFGAFFYNRIDEHGESYTLYALSGVPREAFAEFPMPRNTAVFGPTFTGQGIVRVSDITADPRYGKNPPYNGMPPGHLPVRSYLAVPVISRSGDVLGGLFFGHPTPGVFTEQHEGLISGIASQTAVAMDNARLFEAAQHEIQQRRRMEDHQTLLLKELSHRVKNSLAVVQAIANQTLKNVASPQAFVSTFSGRLMALGRAHDLLSKNDWRGASLQELLLAGLAPFTPRDSGRIELVGEDILLHSDAAPALAMVIHELATNAAKYGALSTSTGSVSAIWNKTAAPGILTIQWTERNGPPVKTPSRRGFGLIFIERVVGHQLDGRATLEFAADGLRCEIEIPLGGERNVQPVLTSSRA